MSIKYNLVSELTTNLLLDLVRKSLFIYFFQTLKDSSVNKILKQTTTLCYHDKNQSQ